MPEFTNETSIPSGLRRFTPAMLAVRDLADAFPGAPRGFGKPFRYLAAFQEAEPYLGLPPQAYKLLAWLVKQTMAHDWEVGSRPICWPSAARQAEFLGLSPARVKVLNRALFEAGIFIIRDSETGKRYGRRGPDKRIVEAYGFDLTPLASRFDEFIRIAAEAKAEREKMKALRKRVTCARRAIRQIGETLAAGNALPPQWPEFAAETAALVRLIRSTEQPAALAEAAQALEGRKAQAEAWLREAADINIPVETSPLGLENEPHTITTNESFNPKDTVIAAEEERTSFVWQNEDGEVIPSPVSSIPPLPAAPMAAAPPLPIPEPAAAAVSAASAPKGEALPGSLALTAFERVEKLNPAELIELAPRLAAYLGQRYPDWRDIIDVAGGCLRLELGVPQSLWGEACRILGRQMAALILAIVSTKPPEHFTRGSGGYFAAMVKRAQTGQLHLDRTLWKLRRDRWNRAPAPSPSPAKPARRLN